MNMNITKQLSQFATQAGGSKKTVHDRRQIMNRLGQHLKDNNIQIKYIDHLKSKHIEGYIQQRLRQDISKRTLQNEMAAIRTTLRQAGRDKLTDSARISNQALALHNASRAGTKTAIIEQQYQ